MNRHLSKIHYYDKSLDDFVSNHNDFVKEKKFIIAGNHHELLLNLCCFHKNKIYKNEREVRYIEIENGYDKPDADDIRLSLSLPNMHGVNHIFYRRVLDAWDKHKTKFDKSIKVDLQSDLDLGRDKKRAYFRRLHLDNEHRNILFEKTVDCPFTKKYVNDFVPSIKIEKIILGYRFEKESLNELRDIVQEIAEKNLGYPIEIELSKLKPYF